jgi:uncharacterized protein YyaL (SSP411 family)
VIACGDGDGAKALAGDGSPPDAAAHAPIPLLEGRRPVDGKAAAYVCRHFTCRAPVTDKAELIAALQ